ncbi:MBG domain-containing protein, partial [Novosphingobium sp. ZW T3_23]|uniref:MBG domain-containing protein n=1 Tax=Novosphingobium sp. ZW T3_23 TaxID=3378084 RepID=UPI003851CBC0
MNRNFALALLASTALLPVTAKAQQLPSGGQVAAGNAAISAPSGGAMTITQGSDRAVINWHDFSVGAGGRVDILQPNAGSALLNRVTGGTSSTIAGQINANGQVFLVNPNGILITPTGSVKAAGFVASTLDLGDAEFMRGEINVFGRGGSVTNQGTISIVKGGFAALIGGKVDNSGLILAPLGKVALGAGTRATLDLEGDGFLQVALPASDSGITMPGRVVADGGAVVISAAQAVDAARFTVNLSGVIEAKGFESKGGTVVLTGDAIALTGASIDVSGTHGGGSVLIGGEAKGQGKLAHAQTLSADGASSIKADATGAGNGGEIVLWSDRRTDFAGRLSARGAGIGIGGDAEISSAGMLNYTGIADLRGSRFGTLLLDPYNILISNAADSGGFTATADDSVINASTLQNALTLANVTVSTGTGGAQAGNITVAAPLTWSSGSTLTLDAANAIAINAPITVSGAGGVALNAGSTAIGNASILNLSFGNGASVSYTGTANSGQRLAINGEAYGLLYSMSDLTGLGYANGRYALANDLASTETYNSAVIPYFSGTLEGLGHHISNLTVAGNNSSSNGGLIGSLNSGGVVRNIGLRGGSVTSRYGLSNGVGGLIGFNLGTVNNAYNTGSVTDGSDGLVGGLIGYNYRGTVSNVYATGSVSVANSSNGLAGGLIGYSVEGTVVDAYATGSVAGSFNGLAGGLIGYANGGTVSNAYATGSVTTTNGSFGTAGGLIGINNNTSVTNAYWDLQTSGQSGSAGGTGLTTAQFQSGAATALGSAFAGGTNGLYPYLASFFPNGVQAISGTAYDASNAAAARAQVGVYANGGLIGGGTISTGANGYYYTIVQAGTLTNATGIGQTITLSGQSAPGSLQYSDRLTLDGNGNISGQTPIAGTFLIDTGRTRWSDLDATFGASAHAALETSLSGLNRQVTATGDFTLDQALTVDGGLNLHAGGKITVAAPINWATNAAVTLNAASAIAINKSIIASGAGQMALNTATSTVSGFSLLNLTFGNGAGISYTAAPNSGQSLSINGDAYTLLHSMSDLAGLNNATGRYALATDLTASNIYTTAVIPTFGGTLEGLGHTISSLRITRTADYTALIGNLLNTGTLRDIGLTGASISGGGYAGGLAGYNAGVIVNASVSGSINSSANNAGGLVGYNGAGLITNVYASGSVSGGQNIGGLVGWAQNGTISNAYATSKVSGSSAVGGVVGNNRGALTQAYATGPVSGTGSSQGGLVGSNGGGTVQSSFWDMETTGRPTSSGGGTGLNTAQFQSGSAAGLGSAFAGGTNGLYPYLASFFPNGVQVISGTAYTVGGVGAANAIVNLYSGSSLLAGGTLATAANGYYYTILPVGTLADGGSVGQTLTLGGASTVSGVDYRDAVSVDPQGNLLGLSVQSGLMNLTTSQTRISDLGAMVQATLGGLTSVDPDISTTINARGNFTFDTSFGSNSSAADLSVNTGGDLSLLAGASLTARNISLSAGGNFINLAGASALDAAGRWLIYLPDALDNAYGGLDSQNTAVWATAAGASISANGNRYIFGESAGTLVMTPLNTFKTYGDTIAPNFAFMVTGYRQGVSGAYQGDSSGLNWTGMPTFASTGAAASANAGAYDITMSGLSGANGYNVSFGTGTLTVTPRGLTVTADALSRLYGNANPALTYSVAGDGLVNGDTLSGALATAATATSNVGTYGITQGSLAAGGNYALTFTGADLTVTPRGLTVTADALSRLYGNANPALTYSVGGDGLVNGDTLSGALATAATAISNVGAYGITQGSLAAGGNYALSFTGADLTVTPRGLTVTADALSRLYGNANPALTYSVGGDGLVNGDTLSGALATAATAISNVGAYGITQGTLAAGGNYALTFTGADLTVTPRGLTVTADALSRLYGNANPALTYSLGGDGLVNGDSLSGALATAATATSNVGAYGITQGTLAAGGNYAL